MKEKKQQVHYRFVCPQCQTQVYVYQKKQSPYKCPNCKSKMRERG